MCTRVIYFSGEIWQFGKWPPFEAIANYPQTFQLINNLLQSLNRLCVFEELSFIHSLKTSSNAKPDKKEFSYIDLRLPPNPLF